MKLTHVLMAVICAGLFEEASGLLSAAVFFVLAIYHLRKAAE